MRTSAAAGVAAVYYACVLLTVATFVGRCGGAAIRNDGDENDKVEPKVDNHVVIEVTQGDTAVLRCPSNDEHHRFQFWWMKPDQIIGPGTALNSDKFKYEVLTGTLYIKVGIRFDYYTSRPGENVLNPNLHKKSHPPSIYTDDFILLFPPTLSKNGTPDLNLILAENNSFGNGSTAFSKLYASINLNGIAQ